MSSISWEDALSVSNLTPSRGNRVELKDLFLRPKAPDEKGGEQEYTIWVLQSPHPYIVHWPNKADEDGKRIDVSFPDQEFTKMTSRVCHKTIVKNEKGEMGLDKTADCPWCRGGYNAQLKYMFNVYDADEKTIRILDVPAKIVDEISKAIKLLAKQGFMVRPGDWSEPCPYFIITAKRASGKNSFGSGSVEYTVTASRADKSVDQEILDAICAISPEAAENCEEVADYKKYLHSLDRWTDPTPVATAEDAERRESSSSRTREKEDSVESLTAKPKVTEQPKASLKKKVQVVEEEEDDASFDDDAAW